MTDVSCRIFSFFEAADRAGIVSLDQLLVASPPSLKVLGDPR